MKKVEYIGGYYVDCQGIRYNINLATNTASVAGGADERCIGANCNVDFVTVAGIVSIPASIYFEGKEYPVVRIEPYAFIDWDGDGANTSIKELQFANGSKLSTLGLGAFRGCTNLLSVNFSNCYDLTEIEWQAFQNCSNLLSINFENCTSLTTIGEAAFWGCTILDSVDLRPCNALTIIEDFAFQDCSNNLLVKLPGDASAWNTGKDEINKDNWVDEIIRTI